MSTHQYHEMALGS